MEYTNHIPCYWVSFPQVLVVRQHTRRPYNYKWLHYAVVTTHVSYQYMILACVHCVLHQCDDYQQYEANKTDKTKPVE